MNGLLFFIAEIAAAFGGVFLLLLIYMRRNGLAFTGQEKKSFVILTVLFFGATGFFFFFEDDDFVFRCGKDTQSCNYYHSTLYNKKIRHVRSYDLSGIKETGIVPHKRSCGRHCSRTVYRVVFNGENNSFEMPKDFDFKEDAEKQAARAAAFLQTDKPHYTYKDLKKNDTGKDFILYWLLFFLVLSSMYGSLSASVIIFKYKTNGKYLMRRKKEKNAR